MKKLLAWFFTIVYFLIFCSIIRLVFTNFISNFFSSFAAESILTIFCWIIAFFISVGLGDYTEKRIRDYYSKK